MVTGDETTGDAAEEPAAAVGEETTTGEETAAGDETNAGEEAATDEQTDEQAVEQPQQQVDEQPAAEDAQPTAEEGGKSEFVFARFEALIWVPERVCCQSSLLEQVRHAI